MQCIAGIDVSKGHFDLAIDFHALSDDFIFDNELLIAAVDHRYQTCEISCPTIYDEDSSSINFTRSGLPRIR